MKITTPLFPHTVSPFICILAFNLAGCGEQAAAGKTGTTAPVAKVREFTKDDHLAHLQKKAEAGNAEAQFKLGWIYVNGEGFTGVAFVRDISKDAAKGFEWYQKAAAQEHVDAQYNLGMLYKLGLGVKEDAEKAFMWLQKAAAQGNNIAQYNLGVMYAEGAGVKPSLPRACAWLTLAAAQGNEKAQKNYFEIEAKLTPVQRDEGRQLAAKWKKGDVL